MYYQETVGLPSRNPFPPLGQQQPAAFRRGLDGPHEGVEYDAALVDSAGWSTEQHILKIACPKLISKMTHDFAKTTVLSLFPPGIDANEFQGVLMNASKLI